MTAHGDSAGRRAELVREILRAGAICPECLGRAFGKLGRGLSNEERGRAIETAALALGVQPKSGTCWLCGGAFSEVAVWAERAAEKVRGVEFRTYLFGVRLSPRLDEMEAYFAERFPTGAIEPAKHAFNRAVGRAFDRLFPGTTVAFVEPDVSFLIDLPAATLDVRIGSLFFFGRYRKLVRGIPQTKWPCRRCGGRGCDVCGGTGKQYPESVEEWVAEPLVDASDAEGARFHGAGREDIDALMLGEGRPFVIEIVAPRKRTLDLEALHGEINRRASARVEVDGLAPVKRRAVEDVKETRVGKRYRARVEFAEDVTADALEKALGFLVGTITQRTPRRVAHRRADKVRMRKLLETTGAMVDRRTAEIEVATEGGLYVKELVSGDDGRTEPSLAGRLGVDARVTELDVVEIMWPRRPDGSVDIPHPLP